MEQKKTTNYKNLLLDNINLPIDITLVSTPKEVSTPSLLNNSPSESLQNTKASYPPISLIPLIIVDCAP